MYLSDDAKAPDATLTALRERHTELVRDRELFNAQIDARIEEVCDMIEMLGPARRKPGRPRGPRNIVRDGPVSAPGAPVEDAA